MRREVPSGARDLQKAIEIVDCYEVVVQCDSEKAQRELFDELVRRGYECRLLVL
jgi:hypothetical protein